ncbi:MAG: radical SAM family heme chaperone HemW [Campylobacterota bacterium]|nr:radical SAM family heme chaperone HemW [Campylobacterota bacterium]
MLLYIHIPFCDSKCHYCAFNSYTYLHTLRDDYMKALEKQLKYELEKRDKKIETIFIGGGTPSTIKATYYKSIIGIVQPYLEQNCEITIEANPNSASKQWLEGIYKAGINRISFGVQSFDDEKLKFLGRNHSKAQAVQAVKDAEDIGFEHINVDIIYDTAQDSKELLKHDIAVIKQLPVDHISAYSLTLEEGTNFYDRSSVRVENIEYANYLFEELKSVGFEQYEISNFSKGKDARSKHNLGYWQYKEYLGIGSGAVGCIDSKRVYGKKEVQEYINDPLEYEDIEVLSQSDIVIEKLLLGFRSAVGVELKILNSIQKEKVYELEKLGKLNIKDDKAYSSDFMLADELALYIEG